MDKTRQKQLQNIDWERKIKIFPWVTDYKNRNPEQFNEFLKNLRQFSSQEDFIKEIGLCLNEEDILEIQRYLTSVKSRRRAIGVAAAGTVAVVSTVAEAKSGFFRSVLNTNNQTQKKETDVSNKHYDIAYVWDDDLESVLDYMDKLSELFGPEVSKDLMAVKGAGGKIKNLYGVVYNRNGNYITSVVVAARHTALLRTGDMDPCQVVPDKDYFALYNISYGLGSDLLVQKTNYRTIARYLGGEVKKDLVIERTDDRNYNLVYKKFDDFESTMRAANNHSKVLSKFGITATAVREKNNDIVYGESSILDEDPDNDIEVKKSATPKIQYNEQTSDKSSSSLENQVESRINSERGKGRLSSGESTSWVVYHFKSGRKLVSINEDVPFQCASMVKPLVALSYFHLVSQGKLKYGDKARYNLTKSIQRSSNPATNWVMGQAGGPKKVQKILKSNYGHIFRSTSIVEKIPSGGRTYRNKASANDYSRFLYALWNDKLPYSRELKRLMALPKRSRVYSGVSAIPSGTLVYSKTGSTSMLCGDMGVLFPRRNKGVGPYIVVGIIQRSSRTGGYGSWIKSRGNVIRGVSGLAYRYLDSRY